MDNSEDISIKTCVVVLGMHRSGTSLLAGVLNILGVDFGKKLIPPGEDNPKGFFENSSLVQANVDFLESFGLDMHGITGNLPATWLTEEKTKEFKEKIRRIIKLDFDGPQLFGFKDPRISILLPVYADVLEEMGIRTVFVVSERPNIEIAASLEKRGFLVSTGIKASKHFKDNINFYTREKTTSRVSFKNLLNSPIETIEKIKSDLKIEIKSYEESKEELKEFIDPKLKHHDMDDDEFVSGMISKVEIASEYTKEEVLKEDGEDIEDIPTEKELMLESI
ncbi:hypothetical protein N9L18_01190 [Candidatus Pacebacteria bacterium]|nr:hypothetical protein [Candidatus Paceibacterota bacterium]